MRLLNQGGPTGAKVTRKSKSLFLSYQLLAVKLTMIQQHLGSSGHPRVDVEVSEVMTLPAYRGEASILRQMLKPQKLDRR